MKKINFIDSVPEQTQYEAHTWTTLTYTLIAISISSIALLHTFQLHEWWQQRNELNMLKPKMKVLNTIRTNQQTLQQQKVVLEKKTTKITQKIEQVKSPLDHLQTIIMTCSQSTIQSLSLDKTSMQLNGHCTRAEDANTITLKLNTSPYFEHVMLASIQPIQSYHRTKMYTFNIRGSVVHSDAT